MKVVYDPEVDVLRILGEYAHDATDQEADICHS